MKKKTQVIKITSEIRFYLHKNNQTQNQHITIQTLIHIRFDTNFFKISCYSRHQKATSTFTKAMQLKYVMTATVTILNK